ncbi:NADH dehydrogenase [Kineosphaera limosa]|uniref:NADH:ubiquinone reductase (non-electrogenic) n=1 Tax=Kineosphaera limosa NBRC 100340 TaxID=1184609 RepID=K6WYH5_9MICO|nr:NAD(P)/FAD-dependent oxidoreductase [Kineosphaera limosa]NYE02542.1 NADH dehydrogenase [Kineosphaera limosa]GAB97157.1 NADH dehydrogenase [Kineosphaera limosa NBRC 100340]
MFPSRDRHNVVVIGSGFGGLFATKALDAPDTKVTLVGKTSHHLFQPLLYQVATGILSEGEIAPPTREILRRQSNARVIQGLVTDIDLEHKTVTSRFHDKETVLPYDSLIVAAGAGQSYFGNDHFAVFAPGMKSIDDALELRSRIFGAFELAEMEESPQDKERLLTFVVIGAGPTGVEMAGQIRELANTTLAREFRRIDSRDARVILLDGAPTVLGAFGDRLGGKAKKALEDMGVEVKLNALVTDVDDTGLTVKHKDGSTERIESACKVWAAGVQGNALGKVVADAAGAELDRAGRVKVQPDLTLPGHPEVFVVGDLAFVEGVPGVAQGAIQGGQHAARKILARLRGEQEPGAFKYVDKGSMATISKFNAIASIGKLRLAGFSAWVMWLAVHLLAMVGFKARVTTLLHWVITFLGNGRAERVTTNQQLVGRLALKQLGQNISGPLLRGDKVVQEEKAPRQWD